MAQDTETFNSELYNLLKVRGYKPVPLNSQNQRVGASQEADVIEFTFTKDGEDYGKVWVSIDDASSVKIYFDDEQQDSPDTTTPGTEYDDTWTGLLKFIKAWAQRRQLSFELTNKDRLGDDMRQRDYYKMKEKLGEGKNISADDKARAEIDRKTKQRTKEYDKKQGTKSPPGKITDPPLRHTSVAESYHSMGKKASYNDAVPNVKIVLQHNRALEEGEQRYRNVARIFLENADGERFLAPTTKPGIARVYARHIAEGGVPNDDRWNHIKSVCEDYNKMAGFVRATRNKEFNESAQDLINEGANHYSNLRETLHKLTGHRGYHAYFESWTPSLMEDEGEDLAINELFVQETVDPRIESVMPILSKLRKNVAEMSEVDTLAEWADSIISEKLEMDSTTKSMAVPADEMLDEAPGAETLSHNQSTEKSNLKAFGLAEEDDDKVVSIKSRKKPFIGALAKDFDDEFGHYDDLGRIGKLAAINRGSEDEMDWDDDSWIPDEEDFEHEEMAKELSRHRGRFSANDVNEMEKDLHSGSRHDPRKGPQGPDKTAKMMAAKDAVKAARKTLDKAFKGDVDENFIGMAPQAVAEEEVEEGLDANQKRVGQLGPTEKVKNNNIGKLVGANESAEIPEELARIMEMARFKR
jgi:hypothetical protein